jgi:hypothetical protein
LRKKHLVQKNKLALIAIAVWAVINILLMALLTLGGDVQDLNNYLEIALWIISVPAVLSGKKWGTAFAIFVLIYTLSTSMGIIIYYQVWLNAVRVVINIPAIIYLFKVLIEGKIR